MLSVRSYFLLINLVAFLPTIAAQSPGMDSLYALYAHAKGDSQKLEAAFAICSALEMPQTDELKELLDATEYLAKEVMGGKMAVRWDGFRGNWYFGLGDVENAYHIAMDCARKFKAMNDTLLQGESLFLAGTALAEFNPKAAIGILEEAFDIAKAIQYLELQANCLTNLAYALDMAGLDMTEQYYSTLLASLETCKKMDFLEGILINNFNLVEYHCGKGEFEKAKNCIAEMRQYLKGSDDELSLAYPMVSEGNVLKAEGKLEAALPKIEAGFYLMKEHNIWDGQWELYPILIDLYKQTGRFEKAFSFLENYQVMKDSMISLEKSKAVQNLQTRYETEKKEAKIAIQQADLARSRQEKWALAAGLALLGGLSVLFWRQRRKTQAVNLELAASNEQIAQKNQKLDLLMRELHHRVKNNLQLVSSLLRLQSRQIGDENAAAAIKAGQLRVEAMSLIHQRLYRTEGISLVNMEEFTQDLLEKIAFAFGFQLEALDSVVAFDPIELDVDKAMPMSLVLNELITNSFKYAFANTSRPAIQVTLSKDGDKMRLHYADNGDGFPDNPSSAASFGSKLIASLCGQLGGQPRTWSDRGANFELVFGGGEV